MQYLEALEKMNELQDFWKPKLGNHSDPLARTIIQYCLNSQPEIFYWSESILDIICESATKIPGSWTFLIESLPSSSGFFWFAKPILVLKSMEEIDDYELDIEQQIQAIHYIYEHDSILLLYYIRFGNLLGNLINTKCTLSLPAQISVFKVPCTLREAGEHNKPRTDEEKERILSKLSDCTNQEQMAKFLLDLISEYSLDIGGAENSFSSLQSLHNPQAKDVKLNIFAAMLAFLQQKILMPVRQVPPRPFRKRAEREHRPLPPISIIKLRELRHHPTEKGEHRDIDWTCQWLVRGHWRDQWYRSIKRNQPIWIAPHIKGPPDKPLRHPERLFAVVR